MLSFRSFTCGMWEGGEQEGKEHEYWHAVWTVERKVRNVHMGICKKMSREEVRAKSKRDKKATEKATIRAAKPIRGTS